jgi:hypothetical protein
MLFSRRVRLAARLSFALARRLGSHGLIVASLTRSTMLAGISILKIASLLDLGLGTGLNIRIDFRLYSLLEKPFDTRITRLARPIASATMCLFRSSPGHIHWPSKPK